MSIKTRPVVSADAALFSKGQAAFQAGQLPEAAAFYRNALAINPSYFSAWMNLGTCLRRMGHLDAAIIAGQRARALQPDNAGCLTNLANAMVDASRIDEALALQRRAHALAPDDLLIKRNLGVALREAGLFDEAYATFTALTSHFPDDVNLPWEQALCLLYQGKYDQGWPAFESRWKLPAMTARWPQISRWQGEDLTGKHLLLTEEQGFGDTLLCARYLPLLIEHCGHGGSVTLACKKPLHRLLSAIGGLTLTTIEDTDAAITAARARYDYQAALMSLPGQFKTDLGSIPPAPPFTSAVPLPQAVVQALKAGKDRLKVGIIWSGSVTFANNRKRAVTAERFLPLAGIDGVELYSLQKGPREGDLRACGGNALIHDIGPLFEDFAQTATTLKQLDLVIMTDSAVAHLAGSLGVPVWNMLHDRPYWLYLSERRDCPWYPSMTLYRQPTPGDWDSVFAAVADDLRQLAAEKLARAISR